MTVAIKQRAHELIEALPDDATWHFYCTRWSFEATSRLGSPTRRPGATLKLLSCAGITA
jgi:hypothetical protein